jgi:hypothetical protein
MRERRRADFVGDGRGGVSSIGSPTAVSGVKKSQRLDCAGRAGASARDGSGFLARPVGFSGIEGTRGLRGMLEYKNKAPPGRKAAAVVPANTA